MRRCAAWGRTTPSARDWSEYTWRGDQAPGFPFVHGLQTTETDFNDLRNSKLLLMIGKNLVENKMPESHFFHEVMERGGTTVTIAPEYSAPATKSDYWIPVRAGLSDTALLLGVAKALIDREQYDTAFHEAVHGFPASRPAGRAPASAGRRAVPGL